MELGPAEGRGDSAAEQHGVEEDESADGCVRVLAKHHQGDEPDSGAAEIELFCRPISHWHADCAEKGIELAHEGVVYFLGICFARLELEGTVVPGKVPRQSNQELAQGRLRHVRIIFFSQNR